MNLRQASDSERLPNPLRIAYFSPLPPEHSGIADYSRELLPYLTQQTDLVLYTANPHLVDEELHEQYVIRHQDRFPREIREFDIPLYQMGNSEYHASVYATMLQYPGLVVLHDYAIHNFIAHYTLDKGDFAGYAREMGYAFGAPGVYLAYAVHLGQAPATALDFPLNDRLLDSSLGLIVHSNFVAGKIRKRGYDRPLAIIPALIEEHPGRARRGDLNIQDDTVLFASFGLITRQKQVDLALRAFKKLREFVPHAHYLLVGEALGEVDIEVLIEDLGLAGDVTHIGYVPDLSGFVDWVHTADIVINLREPTIGETSATALRAMAAGRPLIVFDQGWYSEIPDEAALKTTPLDEAMLLEAMLRLAQAPQLREQMGEAGRRYTREVCHPQMVAEAYVRALSSTLEVHL